VGGFIASIPLVIGCIIALFANLPRGIIAAIMAFGSGVLIAALTFSLMEEAFNLSQSIAPVVIGFILGGISYSVANLILDKKARHENPSHGIAAVRRRKRFHGDNAGGGKSTSGLSLPIGSIMDNIPGPWYFFSNRRSSKYSPNISNFYLKLSRRFGFYSWHEIKWKKHKVHTCVMVYSRNNRNHIYSYRLRCFVQG
jgi:zinc transporter ZupT